jgi:plasmid stabilization system protein ParE
MSLRVIVRPEAEADMMEAAIWYEGRESGMGLEVIAELQAAVERAHENPLSYLLLRKRPHVRRVLARRFPYRIFYIVRSDVMVVFAILHAARDERYWQSRL